MLGMGIEISSFDAGITMIRGPGAPGMLSERVLCWCWLCRVLGFRAANYKQPNPLLSLFQSVNGFPV